MNEPFSRRLRTTSKAWSKSKVTLYTSSPGLSKDQTPPCGQRCPPCSMTAARRRSGESSDARRRGGGQLNYYPLVAPLALSFGRALNLALALALGSGDTCTPTPPAAPSATATPCASGAAARGDAAHRDFLPGRTISSDLGTCTDMCSVLGARSPSMVDMKSPSGRYAELGSASSHWPSPLHTPHAPGESRGVTG